MKKPWKLLSTIALSMALLSGKSYAQDIVPLEKMIVCTSDKNYINSLLAEQEQDLLFTGDSIEFFSSANNDDYSQYSLTLSIWVNQSTGNWAVISVSQDSIYCILNTGNNFQPYTGR